MDIEELLTTTRSARKSLDLSAPVALDDIRDCLRIGLQAANGSNQQFLDRGIRAVRTAVGRISVQLSEPTTPGKVRD